MLLARAQASGGAEGVTDRVHESLVAHGWAERQAVMAATAVRFLVLGAATDATGTQFADDVAERGGTTPLDQFADTIERASFTMALDCLIRGLEIELESADALHAAGRKKRTRRAVAG